MADIKFSALSDGTTPAGADVFAVARAGDNNKLSWTEMLAAMPGAEIGYDEITNNVTVSSTTEASGTTVISCAAHTFDGGPVMVEFYSVLAGPPDAAGFLVVSLFESSTQITRIGLAQNVTSLADLPFVGRYRFTPTAASHTYTVTAFKTGSGTSPQISAAAAGTGTGAPAFIRFTKV